MRKVCGLCGKEFEMKTFKWENAKKVIPLTAGGYSGLIFIAYKVDDEFNPGKNCYEYAIVVYKTQAEKQRSGYNGCFRRNIL